MTGEKLQAFFESTAGQITVVAVIVVLFLLILISGRKKKMDTKTMAVCAFSTLCCRNTDQERKRPLRAENAADATLQSRICREKRPETPFSLLVRIGMLPHPSSIHR